MSPRRSTVAPVPTTVARLRHHRKLRLTNVPVLAGYTCPNLPQSKPRTLQKRAIRTIHADGREEDSEAVTEEAIRTWHHVEAPCVVDGELGFAKLLDIDELLVVRDRALRTLARRKLYQQTLEHILTLVAERNMIIFHNTLMITALTFQCTAHYMFGVQHYRGNTLMAAFMHRYPQHSRYRDVTHDSRYHRPRHENQCSRLPHPPGLEVVPLGGEGRGFLASSCLRFPDAQRH